MFPIRVSAVSYLNSKPFIYGLEHSAVFEKIQLSLDTPADCARKLLNNEVEIGLIPVAVLPQLQNYKIIGNYCIGAVGPVSSVMLYSDVPLKEIKKIVLDYQSRTSVALTKVLAKKHWRINPEWLPASAGFESSFLNGADAAVIIGDRTFSLHGKYKYEYDLSQEWYNFTGLPFVFACWATSKELPLDFMEEFNSALTEGINNLPLIAKAIEDKHLYKTDVGKYLTHFISYSLNDEKRKGLDLFLSYLKEV